MASKVDTFPTVRGKIIHLMFKAFFISAGSEKGITKIFEFGNDPSYIFTIIANFTPKKFEKCLDEFNKDILNFALFESDRVDRIKEISENNIEKFRRYYIPVKIEEEVVNETLGVKYISDRIDRLPPQFTKSQEEEYEIIDYKSGKTKISVSEEYKRQLVFYAKYTIIEKPIRKASIIFTRNGKKIDIEINDDDIEMAQARLAGYQELFRKSAVTDIDCLISEHERLEAELTFLESASVDVSRRLSELEISSNQLAITANELSVARRSAKGAVKRRIEAELHALAMPGAKIDVDLSAVHKPLVSTEFSTFGPEAEAVWARISEVLSGLGEHGAEKAQLLLAANPGEPLLPLQKIASGGEISRIMLALKKALAAGADTCILVFDEIDTGISGRIAAVVGRKMQELSNEFQVICISHLAQVAAHADAHFLVHKLSRDKRTESTISRLSPRSSEEELARLLSGEELTPSSLANARALVKKAKEKTV